MTVFHLLKMIPPRGGTNFERLARQHCCTASLQSGNSSHSCNLHLLRTHEEFAEMIGTSRETVSRLLSDFKLKHSSC